MTFTPRERSLLISSLRQRAVSEANTHYGGNVDTGQPAELNALAAKIEEDGLTLPDRPTSESTDWLEA